MKNSGFTLAEVLITLGIIGVVAAITMPTLIGNYKKQLYYNSFLKSASTVENLWKLHEINYEDDAIEFEEYYKRFAKLSNGKLIKCEDAKSIRAKTLNGTPTETEGNGLYAEGQTISENPIYCGVQLNDNTYLSFADWYGSDWLVDTNGPFKSPNTIGRDIFFFNPFFTTSIDVPYKFIWLGEQEIIDFVDDCMPQGEGGSCAGRLLAERKMNY